MGNPNMEATVSVAVDGVRPTVEITTRQGDYVQHGAQFDIRIEFSEAVQEFSESDIIVTEGTLVEDSLNTDDNIVWNAFVTAGSQGTTVKVDIPDRAARDAVRWWNTAAQRLSLQAVSLPSIPQDLILDQAREETLVFSWLGPESDGGAPLVHYRYRYGPLPSELRLTEDGWTNWIETDSAATTSVTLTGLDDGVEYGFDLLVRNGLGSSKFVEASGIPNPRVTVVRSSSSSTFEGGTVTFTLTREGDTAEALTVDICAREQPTLDRCTSRTGTVTIQAGSRTATYEETTVDDTDDEPVRYFRFDILPQGPDAEEYTYNPGGRFGAYARVIDNDGPVITIVPAAYSDVEEGDPATFTLTRNGDLTQGLTVNVVVTHTGGFVEGTPPTQAVFLAEKAATTLSVSTVEDDLIQDDGSVTVTVQDGNDVTLGVPFSATRAVVNDDRWQLVTIAPKSNYNAVEGRDAIFVLTRKQINDDDTTDDDVSDRGPLTVTVALSEEVPDAGAPYHTPRYTTGNERTVTFAAGASTATLRVATAENRYDQTEHKLTATPEDGAGYRTPAAGEAGDSAKVTIKDDEGNPGISISAPEEVKEGEDAVFTFTRSGDTTVGLRLHVSATGILRVLSPEAALILPRRSIDVYYFGRFSYGDKRRNEGIAVDFQPGSATTTLTLGTQADETAEGDGFVGIRLLGLGDRYYLASSPFATIKVKDDDTAVLTLELVDPPPAVSGQPNTYRIEEGAALTWRVTRTGGTDHDFFYGYETDRTSGLDQYNDSSGWRPSWDFGAHIGDDDIVDQTGISAIADRLWSIYEGSMRTTVRTRAHFVTPSGGELHMRLRDPYPGCNRCPQYTLGTPNEFRLIITNRTPGVSITADSDSVEEGGSVTFTLTRTWNEENTRDYATHVDLAFQDPDGVISGTPPATVTIPRGQTSATFTLLMTDDEIDDDAEREFTVSVAAPENPSEQTFEGEFEALAPHTATVTVTDNDEPPLPEVTVTLTGPESGPEGTTFKFSVARDGDTAAPLTVRLNATDIGNFIDPDNAPSATITIPAGRESQQYAVRTKDDGADEVNGSVTVTIGRGAAYTIGDPSSATAPVYDNDGPTLSIEEPENPTEEADTTITFTVRLSNGSGTYTVDWVTRAGTATPGSDYIHSSGTLTFNDSPTETITVSIKEDTEDEDDETFYVVLRNARGARVAEGTAKAVIADDDDATVTASLETIPESDVIESAGHLELLVKLSAPSQNTVEVDWRTIDSAGGGAALAGADYFTATGTAVFPRGSTEQRIRLTIRDDKDDEDSEFVYFGLSEARNASILSSGRNAYGWIRDDDVRGVTASPAVLSIPEDGNDTYTLVLDTRPTGSATVVVNVPADSDLSASPSTLTFTRLNWDQAQTVTVSAAADADNIADAPVDITHSASGGDYGPAPTDSVTVTITGDAGGTLTVADAGAAEGDGEIVFPVTLLGSTSSQVTVNYATSDGTATAGQDYTSTSGTLTFAAGNTGTQYVRVPVTDDSDAEQAETLTLTLTGAVNAALADATATGTITDNDSGFSVTGGRAMETGGEIVFTVTRNGSTRDSASVWYATEDGTATAGADYTARAGGITFLAGESSKAVSVPVINDLMDEPVEETFTLRLVRSTGAAIAPGKDSAAGVIEDDDPNSRVSFGSSVPFAKESEGPLEFSVKLSPASGFRVEVDYATVEVPGEAEAGSDFIAVDDTLVFEPGETVKAITVQLVDDDVAEEQEYVRLALRDAVNAVISVRETAGSIRDDDPYKVTVTARRDTTLEGDELVFNLQRDGHTLSPLTVTLGRTITVGETTSTADDVTVTFEGHNGFAGTPGKSTATYSWQTEVDAETDTDKVYTVTVKDDADEPPDYQPGTPASASVTVTDLGSEYTETDLLLTYETLDSLWVAAGDEVSVRWTVRNFGESTADGVEITVDNKHALECGNLGPGKSCSHTFSKAATATDVNNGEMRIVAVAWDERQFEGSNVVELYFPKGGEHILAVTHATSEDEYACPSVKFTVSLNEQSAQQVTVNYATSDGTATGGAGPSTGCRRSEFTPGVDFLTTTGTLTFTPGQTEKQVSVRVFDDTLLEADETIYFTISSPTGAELDSDRSMGMGYILDNDQPATNPSITIARVGDGNEVAENAGYAEFKLTLSGATNDTVTVNWAAAGLAGDDERAAASAGMDYTAVGGTAVFAPRTTEQRIRVPILDDMIDEPNLEYLRVALSDPVSGTIGETGTIDLAIRDDDERGLTLYPSNIALDEGETRSYSVSLTSQPTEAEGVTVTISSSSDAVVSIVRKTLKFTRDNWRDAQMVKITAPPDDNEYDQHATLTHSPAGSDYDDVGPVSMRVEVWDLPVVAVTGKTVKEDDGTITVQVDLNRAWDGEITVDWETVDGTATAGSDYVAGSGKVTFAADDTSESISLTITDDSLDEDNETFTIALSNPVGESIIVGTAPDATVTINDNDDFPRVTVGEAVRGSEASREAQIRIGLTAVSGRRTAATWETQKYEGANAATPGEDFTSARGEVVFQPGEVEKLVTVVIVDDHIVEPEERFVFFIRSTTNADLPDSFDLATGFPIIDNDAAGVEVSPTAVNVPEGAAGEYTLRLTSQPSADVTITVTVPANTDLTASPTSLTFTSSNWDQPQTVTLTAAEDADLADDEVSLTHAASGGGYGDVSVDGVTATIVDNDFPTLSIADGEADEDDGSIEFTVTLSQAGGKDIAVSWSTTDGTASGGTDYSAVTAGSLTIPAGDTTATLTVTVLDDGVVEPDETFTVTLADPVNATLADATATGTINNDDEIAVTVEPTALTIGEGGSDLYRVSIGSQPTGGDVTVVVTVPSDTDVSAGPTTLTFTAGNWRWPQYVVVNTLSDDDAVADAPVTLTHAVSGGGYGSVTASAVTVTITEENERGVDVSPTTLSLDEGESGVYSVVLQSQPTANVTVTITVPADAGATVDKTSLTFTSDNWDDAQEVEVSATEDDDASSPDPFTITHAVSGGDYASESADSVTVTVDDTTVPMLVFQGSDILTEGVKAAESAGTMAFVVSLQIESGETVTVNYSTSNGTATAGSDYTRTAGRLTFSAGETTKTISVPVLNDRVDEDDETFTLTLSNAVNADLSGGESSLSVEGTIEDDDERGLVLSSDTIGVPEGERRTYTVVLKSQPTQSVDVTLEVPPGAEFAVNTSKLAFTPSNWNTPQNVIVNAYQDRDAQPDPKAAIEHTAVGGDYGDPRRNIEFPNVTASMDVIVLEDDEPTVTLSLDPDTISEDGGVATVTASLSEQSSAETTIVVSIDPTDTSTLGSNTTLTIAANQTTSTGEVTITAVNDSAYAGDREVTVKGAAENTAGVDGPDDVTLTITDDEAKPVVTLALTPSTISESGASNASTVTATLSATSSEDTTITVSIDPTDTSTLSSNVTLTIAKGTTSSTGEVTITATDDSAYTGNREVTVSGSAENTAGVDGPDDVTLTITDDEAKPVVTLALDSDSISENAGVATVTASLDKQSTAATTVTVSIDPTDTSTLRPTAR